MNPQRLIIAGLALACDRPGGGCWCSRRSSRRIRRALRLCGGRAALSGLAGLRDPDLDRGRRAASGSTPATSSSPSTRARSPPSATRPPSRPGGGAGRRRRRPQRPAAAGVAAPDANGAAAEAATRRASPLRAHLVRRPAASTPGTSTRPGPTRDQRRGGKAAGGRAAAAAQIGAARGSGPRRRRQGATPRPPSTRLPPALSTCRRARRARPGSRTCSTRHGEWAAANQPIVSLLPDARITHPLLRARARRWRSTGSAGRVRFRLRRLRGAGSAP